jgi:hypothetical protein
MKLKESGCVSDSVSSDRSKFLLSLVHSVVQSIVIVEEEISLKILMDLHFFSSSE